MGPRKHLTYLDPGAVSTTYDVTLGWCVDVSRDLVFCTAFIWGREVSVVFSDSEAHLEAALRPCQEPVQLSLRG